ncbi:MAG: FecR domain-containing protein [Luteolibacter sp.]
MFLIPVTSNAEKFDRAEVSKIINDVRLLTGTKTSQPAKKGSIVSGETAVRTGQKSRAQMDFPDASIVRLGSNSVFSFMKGERDVDLEKGTILMQVPKGLGRTNIRTSSISAAITGTTILIEYVPPITNAAEEIITQGTFKAIVIEGTLELELVGLPGQTIVLQAGEMTAFPTNTRVLPKKFVIDLARLIETSNLIEGDMGPLPDMPIMIREVQNQNEQKQEGRLVEVSAVRNPEKLTPMQNDDVNRARRPDPAVQLPERPFRP